MSLRASATATRTDNDSNPAITSGYGIRGRYIVGDLPGRVAAVMKSASRAASSDSLSAIAPYGNASVIGIPVRDEPSFDSRITAAVRVQETPAALTPTYVTLQEWEGCVDRVEGQTLFARLRNITGGVQDLSELAEIPLEEIGQDDVVRLVPGSLFRWAIGYRRSSGVQERFSRIIVRHLPAWTHKDMTNAESFARKYRGLFQGSDAGTTAKG
jgi:hypothetical protein